MKKLFINFAVFAAMGLAITSCSSDDGGDGKKEEEFTLDTATTNGITTIAGTITEDFTMSNDVIWNMTEKVWVNDGATLTIEEGTIIKANAKTDPADAVALIVTQGGKINAVGTKDAPIIFTAAADDITYTGAGTKGSDVNGQWGGVVIMGKATCDTKDETNGVLIEGVASDETRGLYGTTTIDNDNSGTLKYVSIRHGGQSVSAESELNGLSLYGVGSGTTIEYIEIFANDDDGIEFFGGTVEVDYALVSHVTDDSFDWDQGWTGGGKYWATIQNADSDKGFECDGGEGDKDPNSNPVISNFTLIGAGNKPAMDLKKSTGATLSNGLVFNFALGLQNQGASDSELSLKDIIVDNIEADSVYSVIYGYEEFDDESDTTFSIVDPSYATNVVRGTLSSLSYTDADGSADVIPTAAEAGTPYKGAFDPSASTTWAAGWTRASQLGLVD